MSFIIPIIILLICLITLALFVGKIIKKVQTLSTALFNTDNLIEGIQKRNSEVQHTPKSISGMTRIYLPQISNDFPEFHFNEMRERAESLLKSYFYAINKNDESLITEGSRELRNQLSIHLSSNNSLSKLEHFENPKIHQTEIYKYSKAKGKVIITFQSSVQYIHYFTDSYNNVIEGDKDSLKQTLFNVSVFYIQDSNIVENSMEQGIGLNCPNCGAPIHSLGLKYCEYCGTEVIEVNRFVWVFGEVVEDSKYS